MKRLSTVFALAALAATTLALAQQQTAPQPQAQTPSSQSQSQSSSDSKADKQALMKDCLTQVRAANPSADEKDIKDYCTKKVNSYSSPHD